MATVSTPRERAVSGLQWVCESPRTWGLGTNAADSLRRLTISRRRGKVSYTRSTAILENLGSWQEVRRRSLSLGCPAADRTLAIQWECSGSKASFHQRYVASEIMLGHLISLLCNNFIALHSHESKFFL